MVVWFLLLVVSLVLFSFIGNWLRYCSLLFIIDNCWVCRFSCRCVLVIGLLFGQSRMILFFIGLVVLKFGLVRLRVILKCGLMYLVMWKVLLQVCLWQLKCNLQLLVMVFFGSWKWLLVLFFVLKWRFRFCNIVLLVLIMFRCIGVLVVVWDCWVFLNLWLIIFNEIQLFGWYSGWLVKVQILVLQILLL